MYRYSGHALLLVLGALFVFQSPFTRWWAEKGLPWYTVFVLWLALIILIAIDNAFSSSRGEGSSGEGSSSREGVSSDQSNSGGDSSGGNASAVGNSNESNPNTTVNKDNLKYPGDTNGD